MFNEEGRGESSALCRCGDRFRSDHSCGAEFILVVPLNKGSARRARIKSNTGKNMKLTLHIGMGKAGSTSIQECLYAARDDIRKYGCLFPDTLYIPARHHWLQPLMYNEPMRAPSVINRMGFSNEAAHKGALEEWENLLAQLKPQEPEHLILSSEVLFASYSKDEAERARKYLPTLTDDIQVLAYVRSPVKRYLSRVQQALKSTNQIVQPGGTYTAKVLNSYRGIYGDVVQTRVFEKTKLVEHDVVADFLQWADLPIPYETLPKMQSNESVSAEGMAILHEMSPPDHASNEDELDLKRKRFRAIMMADREIEAPTKPKLRPEIAEYINAQCSELPLLRDEFGLEFEDIDYSVVSDSPKKTLTITRIDEICAYDPERKELVQNLAEKNLRKYLARAKGTSDQVTPEPKKKKGLLGKIKSVFSGK